MPPPGWEAWLPLLVHIQSRLDEDLSLAALARHGGLTPAQLQRRFSASLGESPKRYVTRLRLERAAFRLRVHDRSVLAIALESGFASHETFTRAFRRRFGCTPQAWRERRSRASADGPAAPRSAAPAAQGHGFELSATRVTRLREQHLAFVRHVGPYEAVPGSIFEALAQWADARALPHPRIWMGIGHDAPDTTPAQKLRFDAALVVPAPVAPCGRVAHQVLPATEVALTTHVGPFDTLPEAYARIFPRALALPGYRLLGVPAIEIYRSAQGQPRVDVQHPLNETDICLPVERC
jgi:AraC family transcriptional regulator